MTRPLVSIAVPAYNEPDYLRKLLRSIVEQEHRPLEVIVSDDASPTPLCDAVEEFRQFEDGSFTLRFQRQEKNLGVMGNFLWVVDQARGRYVTPIAHDNWFTDPRFLAEAVDLLEANPDCHLAIANGVQEDDGSPCLRLPAELRDRWTFLPGDELARRWMTLEGNGMGWTQAFVLDNRLCRELGVFHAPYYLGEAEARKLGVGADNIMAYVYVLASAGRAAVTGRSVVVVGTPPESYSRNETWRRGAAKVKFIVLLNVARARLSGPHANGVRRAARRLAEVKLRQFGWDSGVARHFRFDPEVLALMGRAALKNRLRSHLRARS